MTRGERTSSVATLLREAAQTHHIVYRITDGDDPDRASFYADWLVRLSELPEALGTAPVRSHLVAALVRLDEEDSAAGAPGRWEDVYAEALVERFGV